MTALKDKATEPMIPAKSLGQVIDEALATVLAKIEEAREEAEGAKDAASEAKDAAESAQSEAGEAKDAAERMDDAKSEAEDAASSAKDAERAADSAKDAAEDASRIAGEALEAVAEVAEEVKAITLLVAKLAKRLGVDETTPLEVPPAPTPASPPPPTDMKQEIRTAVREIAVECFDRVRGFFTLGGAK